MPVPTERKRTEKWWRDAKLDYPAKFVGNVEGNENKPLRDLRKFLCALFCRESPHYQYKRHEVITKPEESRIRILGLNLDSWSVKYKSARFKEWIYRDSTTGLVWKCNGQIHEDLCGDFVIAQAIIVGKIARCPTCRKDRQFSLKPEGKKSAKYVCPDCGSRII